MTWPQFLFNECSSGLSNITREQVFLKFKNDVTEVLERQNSRYLRSNLLSLEDLNSSYHDLALGPDKPTMEKPILRRFTDGTVWIVFQINKVPYHDFFLSPTTTSDTLQIIFGFMKKQAELRIDTASEAQTGKLLRSITNTTELIDVFKTFKFGGFYINPDNSLFLSSPSIELLGRFKGGGDRVTVRISASEMQNFKGVKILISGVPSIDALRVEDPLKRSLKDLFQSESSGGLGSGAKMLSLQCRGNVQGCLDMVHIFGERYIDSFLF